MRKIIRLIINSLCGVIIAAAIFVLLAAFLTRKNEAPSILGYSAFHVLTGSMEPTISADDFIIVKRVGADQIQENDVITFYSADPELSGGVVTHRVTEVSELNGQRVFYTKGDANILVDDYPVTEEGLIGLVTFSSPILGILVRLVSNPIIFVVFIILPLIAIMSGNMVKAIRMAKRAAAEEQREIRRLQEEILRKKQSEMIQTADTEQKSKE